MNSPPDTLRRSIANSAPTRHWPYKEQDKRVLGGYVVYSNYCEGSTSTSAASGQRGFHRGGGLLSHAEQDVRVAVKGKGHESVTEKLLDEFVMMAAGEFHR